MPWASIWRWGFLPCPLNTLSWHFLKQQAAAGSSCAKSHFWYIVILLEYLFDLVDFFLIAVLCYDTVFSKFFSKYFYVLMFIWAYIVELERCWNMIRSLKSNCESFFCYFFMVVLSSLNLAFSIGSYFPSSKLFHYIWWYSQDNNPDLFINQITSFILKHVYIMYHHASIQYGLL